MIDLYPPNGIQLAELGTERVLFVFQYVFFCARMFICLSCVESYVFVSDSVCPSPIFTGGEGAAIRPAGVDGRMIEERGNR